LKKFNSAVLKDLIPQCEDIKGISLDSRYTKEGDLFLAYKGSQADGNNYIKEAFSKGAVAVLSDSILDPKEKVFILHSLKNDLGKIISNVYENPSKKLKLIAVTGTNGKTSTVEFLSGLLNQKKARCGYLSTIGWCLDGVNIQTKPSLTTPNSLEINKQLSQMSSIGMEYAALEASSHGLDQGRLNGLEINTAIFTSFSQDHLDYHKTMENYAASKKKLFFDYAPKKSVINIDNNLGENIYSELKASNSDTISISKSKDADILYTCFRDDLKKIVLKVSSPFGNEEIKLNTHSEYLAVNALCSIISLALEGFELQELAYSSSAIKFSKGRMTPIELDDNNICFIDYAHTPEALEFALKALRSLGEATLWCLFGCGGERDKSKRMEMGKISINYSDKVVLTNDNPRSEEPSLIIEDIMKGIESNNDIKVELDRKKAIEYCLTEMIGSKKKNILLIAGKGHEEYQEINGKKNEFSDFIQVNKFLDEV
tara:strand:+ start:1189 stop:2643 length:1455 start_codon:yes stop_codon:yes gene_type:complete